MNWGYYIKKCSECGNLCSGKVKAQVDEKGSGMILFTCERCME